MNILPCPECRWPMKVLRLAFAQPFMLVCPECKHVEPLPVDQALMLAKAPRLL